MKYIEQAFEQNWIAPLGLMLMDLRMTFLITMVDHAAALSSGTAALHLALILLGVKARDEVIA